MTGNASQLMVGFNHTNSEYEAALLLKQTYGNKNKLIEAHLFTIHDLNVTGKKRNLLEGFARSTRVIYVA